MKTVHDLISLNSFVKNFLCLHVAAFYSKACLLDITELDEGLTK